jgi:hyperosmotically inducible protein
VAAFVAAAASPRASLGAPAATQTTPYTDDAITDYVRLKLAADSIVRGAALNVVVVHGIVTLSGAVSTRRAKTRATELARRVKGVKKVVNEITVRQ